MPTHADILSLVAKVTGIILRGIFLLRKKELDWFYEGGAAAIFPDGMMIHFIYICILLFDYS